MTAQPERFITVEEYLALDQRNDGIKYEYLDGHISAMAGGTAAHSRICANANTLLSSSLAAGPCAVYTSDMRVQIAATRYVYPDVTVSCDAADLAATEAILSPRCVVEVLSPSTERYDRTTKMKFYRACTTIAEVLLIDAHRKWVERFRRVGDVWDWQAFEVGDQIDLASLDVTIAVTDLYQKVVLPPANRDDPLV